MSTSQGQPGHGRRLLQRYINELKVKPDEARTAGVMGGMLWFVGGCTLIFYPWLPDNHVHAAWVYAIAAAAMIWGVASVRLIRWESMPLLTLQFTTLIAFPITAVAVASTGGATSNGWVYLWFVGYFGFYFFGRRVAALYIVGCCVVQALPLVYDSRTVHDGYLSLLVITVGAYIAIGCAVIFGKERFDQIRASEASGRAQNDALRRAATAAVRGNSPEVIYETIVAEVSNLIGAESVAVFEVTGVNEATVLSVNVPERQALRLRPGSKFPLPPQGPFGRAVFGRRTIVDHNVPAGTMSAELGVVSILAAPVMLESEVWGVLGLATFTRSGFRPGAVETVEAFAELLSEIVRSLAERRKLEADAVTDPLTGLANRGALDRRLGIDLAAAARHGYTLTVAMIDLDNFKEINDLHGHIAGDDALRAVAACLTSVKRLEDTVGRFGGDEFMWIMPGADRHQALYALERARSLIAAAVSIRGGLSHTSSAGLCDTTITQDPAELVRLADTALYASKAGGRDRATVYDRGLEDDDEDGRGGWRERSQAIDGLRALARAIDAKDPATREHSERVAEFVERLASAAGWSQERVTRLKQAALVHDVGKLGVPDTILTKPGRLTEAEFELMKEHVEMSARIVGGILTEEQVEWIRGHHERPDGRGYPSGLINSEIPEGAGLIALADTWDVMIVGRSYSSQKPLREAFEECVQLEGKQFIPIAVRALKVLRDRGELALAAPASPPPRVEAVDLKSL